MHGYHPSFRPGAPQQPPPTQPYAPQQFPTSQPDLPLSTQSQPQPPSFSKEDLENVLKNELHRIGTHILQLVDGQTRAVQAGRIPEAVTLSEQCDQEMARYKERSEFVVRALETRRAEAKAVLDQWSQWPSHPTGESAESNDSDGRWSVTLRWSHMNNFYQTRVLAADIMGNPCVHSFVDPLSTEDLPSCRLAEWLPENLLLEGVECAMDIKGFQGWISKVKKKTGNTSEPSAVQFQPTSENERHSFNQLIKWLRDDKGVSQRCSPQAVL
ncbi:hypothetical protein BJV78DRAFT_631159 [Lactifluus subvellereus]|nr:hypothetical protein BJV78DRAFT_631159 [Lactifluus subvellereus]